MLLALGRPLSTCVLRVQRRMLTRAFIIPPLEANSPALAALLYTILRHNPTQADIQYGLQQVLTTIL